MKSGVVFMLVAACAAVAMADAVKAGFHGKLGNAFGMQSGAILDQDITASSIHGGNDYYYGPKRARLNTADVGGGWGPSSAVKGEWLQVDLKKIQPVGGVASQGMANGDNWVREYGIMYSTTGGDWKHYTEKGQRRIFTANYDRNTVVQHIFAEPFMARYVRFVVEAWGNFPFMRVEIYSVAQDAGANTGDPLGISTGEIKNDAFQASSAHENNWNYYGPINARLNTQVNFGGWCPRNNRPGEWIQVDLGKVVSVGGIATQGRAHGSYWVSSYTLMYSRDGDNWINYGKGGETEVLLGNDDFNSIVKHELVDFRARYVRLTVENFANGWPTLRWELYAPEKPTNRLGAPLGLANKNIPDSALTASSSHGGNPGYYGPQFARLFGMGGAGGWIPNVNSPGQWVQVDLGRVMEVGGIATQGQRNGYYWVRSYIIMYSLDGLEWASYSMDGEESIFAGNSDTNSIVKHVLQAPFLARYVRIVVRSFANGWPSLRFELYPPWSGRDKSLELLGQPFGLENGVLPNSALSASTTYKTDNDACVAANARLGSLKGAGAWIASSNTIGQFLEIKTLDNTREIGGFALQGRAEKSELYPGAKQWVTAVTIAYSEDGKTWEDYKENGLVRYFRGNQEGTMVVKHAFENPFTAVAVRILPTSWYGAISMRAELYDTARYRLKLLADEKAAKEKAAKEAAIQAKVLAERLEKQKFDEEKAKEVAEAQERAALNAKKDAEVEAAQAKTKEAQAAAAILKAQAEKDLAAARAREAEIEAQGKADKELIEKRIAEADARKAALNAKLDEHRANNRRLLATQNKLKELQRTLEDLRQQRLDTATERHAESADFKADRAMTRKLAAKVEEKLLELYRLRDAIAKKARDREQGIRLSEEKSYLHYLQHNNPWRKTDPTGWPVKPQKKICTCKNMENPLDRAGRKMGSAHKLGKDDATWLKKSSY